MGFDEVRLDGILVVDGVAKLAEAWSGPGDPDEPPGRTIRFHRER